MGRDAPHPRGVWPLRRCRPRCAGAGRDDGSRRALSPRRLASLVSSALDETGEDTIVPGGSIDFDAIAGDQFVVVLEGESAPCPGDLNGDGQVNGADFGALLAAWGPCSDCPEDLDGDGQVAGGDVGLMLSQWGPCP